MHPQTQLACCRKRSEVPGFESRSMEAGHHHPLYGSDPLPLCCCLFWRAARWLGHSQHIFERVAECSASFCGRTPAHICRVKTHNGPFGLVHYVTGCGMACYVSVCLCQYVSGCTAVCRLWYGTCASRLFSVYTCNSICGLEGPPSRELGRARSAEARAVKHVGKLQYLSRDCLRTVVLGRGGRTGCQ